MKTLARWMIAGFLLLVSTWATAVDSVDLGSRTATLDAVSVDNIATYTNVMFSFDANAIFTLQAATPQLPPGSAADSYSTTTGQLRMPWVQLDEASGYADVSLQRSGGTVPYIFGVSSATFSSAAGIWTGTTPDDRNNIGTILRDGRYFFVVTAPGNPNVVNFAAVGKGKATKGTFASSSLTLFVLPGGAFGPGTFSADYVTDSLLNGTLSGTVSQAPVSLRSSDAWDFDKPVNRSVDGQVASAVRQWAMSLHIGSGTISGTDEAGCTRTGSATPSALGPVYELSVTYGSQCPYTGQTFTGVAGYSPSKNQFFAVVTNADGTAAEAFLGNGVNAFSITLGPSAVSGAAGQTASTQVKVNRMTGFNDLVSLSGASPDGIAVTVTPATLSATDTAAQANLTIPTGLPNGTYTVGISASSPSAPTQTAPLTVTVCNAPCITALATGLDLSFDLKGNVDRLFWRQRNGGIGDILKALGTPSVVTSSAASSFAVDAAAVYYRVLNPTPTTNAGLVRIAPDGSGAKFLMLTANGSAALTTQSNFAVDLFYVYWAVAQTIYDVKRNVYQWETTVYRVDDFAGGTPEVLVDLLVDVTGAPGRFPGGGVPVAVDGAYVYFNNGTDIQKVPKGGGTATPVATGLNGAWGLWVDADAVYWRQDIRSSVVWSASKATGAVTTRDLGGGVALHDLTVDDAGIYAVIGPTIVRADKSGPSPTVTVVVDTQGSLGVLHDILVDSTNVYFMADDMSTTPAKTGIYQHPK